MNRKSRKEIFLNGVIYENPLLVMMLGVCPALSVTTQAKTGFFMGLATLFVVTFSNIMISALKRIIPQQVRIPCHMVIIASFVTIARYLITAYFPGMNEKLGVYLPLMVVNCAIFSRAEIFATKNSIANSAIDGLGTGLGYTLALTLMGAVRELFGSGTLFGISLGTMPVRPLPLFQLLPGGLLVLGLLAACSNKLMASGNVTPPSPCESCPAASACAANAKEDAE